MSNDSRTELIEQLRKWIDDGMKLIEPYRRAYAAALAQGSENAYTLRFANLATIDAILKFLREDAPEGADEARILEELRVGGLSLNKPNFERDVVNSLKAGVRNGILLREKGVYLPGGKMPSHKVNWHKRQKE